MHRKRENGLFFRAECTQLCKPFHCSVLDSGMCPPPLTLTHDSFEVTIVPLIFACTCRLCRIE